ncbi:TlpA disulfide reductase family protein [Piscinibacter gummiphilus]|uniref:TlpA disulfide reductase family protein n=1 Tax=Piscinibacter gummiphilus TaxID=946333 RepID=A0ABZ0CUL6_9BURK|nr:TlpA disulfide reductase family protein [Piscinibacter gummiphilus]WOB06583.1 TlpA disulfide reductase family protein [Piscinibacter gummiphilus]
MTSTFFRIAPSALLRPLLGALLLAAASWSSAAVPVGANAPDFTLKTLNGPNMRLQEQRGKVVLVNFWATWCGPCRKEMPHLNRIADKYKSSGLVLMGVNIDEDVRNAAEVAGKLKVSFPVLLDTDKAVSKMYDLNSMPSTMVIDRSGKVRYVHRGYQDGYEDTYDQQIRELLKER